MKILLTTMALTTAIFSSITLAMKYEVPPSSSTSSNVSYISDKAMEQCVKLYNEAKWLGEKISSTAVDSYSKTSVEAYNREVKKHTNMTSSFNKHCSGKQSESAYKAAKKLNN